ncbi:unnamed protein product [Clonostachys chloroleuca]|uniref:Zn(2)-C6 fungal-type domain-containing protein n=1 Tax=Clonostachys chloroleuca TaxID=1926264 RepID=A0AA35LUJ9_9HYPO|nr:unnamed protein product [Clonostachys chloroleuca]
MDTLSEWQSNMEFDIRGPPQPQKFSCKRCQLRKLRCSRTEPCSNCQRSRQVCEYRNLTSRKRPAAKEYVVGLEKRVAWLESLIVRLKAASLEERDTMLEAVSLSDDLLAVSDQVSQVADNRRTASEGLGSQHFLHGSFQIRPGGYMVYHGASSVFYALKEAKSLASKRRVRQSSYESVSSPSSSIYVGSGTDFNHVAQHFGIDMNDDLITKMLMQFFKWQYPYFMFIYREAFLRDHTGDRAGSPYWSTALVLSMCALGALTSDEESERSMSGQFFSAAETIAIVSGLARPSITTVQTFLCLAFYEIGRGEPSKAWGFSGIAFRMAQDLGFQKDPDHWVSHHTLATVPEDIEIRRRIYWGCYCSDKIISLILGRPVQLYRADGEVHDRLVGLP